MSHLFLLAKPGKLTNALGELLCRVLLLLAAGCLFLKCRMKQRQQYRSLFCGTICRHLLFFCRPVFWKCTVRDLLHTVILSAYFHKSVRKLNSSISFLPANIVRSVLRRPENAGFHNFSALPTNPPQPRAVTKRFSSASAKQNKMVTVP